MTAPEPLQDSHDVLRQAIESSREAERTGNLELLAQAITLGRVLTASSDEQIQRDARLNLAVDLTEWFRRTLDRDALTEAIQLGEHDTTHDRSAEAFNNLAARYYVLAEADHDPDPLSAAIAAYKSAVSLDPELTEAAANLATALAMRFDWFGDRADLDAALLASAAAVDRDPAYGANHATILLTLHEQTGDPNALDAAARLAIAAAEPLMPTSSLWRIRANNAAQILRTVYELDGNVDHLDTAETLIAEALDSCSVTDSFYTVLCNTAAVIVTARYDRTGERGLLDQAIRHAETAHERDDNDTSRAARTNSLLLLLTNRYETDGDTNDLQRGITIGLAALDGFVDFDTVAALRTNLSDALHKRYQRTGERGDLDDAGTHLRAAIDATTDGAAHAPARLDALAAIETERAALLPDPDRIGLIDMAIGYSREAIRLTALESPQRILFQSNLANRLIERYDLINDPGTLDEAHELLSATRRDAPAGSVAAATATFNYGVCQLRRHEATDDLDQEILQDAVDAFEELCDFRFPHLTIPAAVRLINICAQFELWSDCVSAATIALDAADELVVRREHLGDRRHARADIQGVAGVAALAAHRAGQPETGVHTVRRAVATIARLTAPTVVRTTDPSAKATRSSDPKTPDDAATAYVVATPLGGLVLTATSSAVTGVELPGFTSDEVLAQLDDLDTALNAISIGISSTALANRAVEALLAWTWNELSFALQPFAGTHRRLTVVPVGATAALPIGAARASHDQPTLSELTEVCVAPDPNLTATPTRQQPKPLGTTVRAVVIGHSGPPDRHLAHVEHELDIVRRLHHLAPHPDPATPLNVPTSTSTRNGPLRGQHTSGGHVATTEFDADLRQQLSDAEIVHVACHFDMDPDDPLHSTIVLEPSLPTTALTTITFRANPTIVLSGCSTGIVGRSVPDELITIPAELLHHGAGHVIASLWRLQDEATPPIMETLHRELTHNSAPAALRATQLHHRATDPLVWASLVIYSATPTTERDASRRTSMSPAAPWN